jgi:hypothetical protein
MNDNPSRPDLYPPRRSPEERAELRRQAELQLLQRQQEQAAADWQIVLEKKRREPHYRGV